MYWLMTEIYEKRSKPLLIYSKYAFIWLNSTFTKIVKLVHFCLGEKHQVLGGLDDQLTFDNVDAFL